ncbi:MAG: Ku protein, partial [Thermoanaerobaculia bacterium]
YAERLETLAKKKSAKGEDVLELSEAAAAENAEPGGEVVDILEVLKRSLGGSVAKKPARQAPKRAAKKSAKKK